jgi:hypothetical protein
VKTRRDAFQNCVYGNRLMCYVKSLHYDWLTRIGTLTIHPDGCTDMTGAVGLFKSIDPSVLTIDVKCNTPYRYQFVGGKWCYVDLTPQHRDEEGGR